MRKDLVIGGADFGSTKDPMVGKRIGGVNVFGGGLGLYKDGKRVGGCKWRRLLHRPHGRVAYKKRVGTGRLGPGRRFVR
jgi:hypothetical protein